MIIIVIKQLSYLCHFSSSLINKNKYLMRKVNEIKTKICSQRFVKTKATIKILPISFWIHWFCKFYYNQQLCHLKYIFFQEMIKTSIHVPGPGSGNASSQASGNSGHSKLISLPGQRLFESKLRTPALRALRTSTPPAGST